MHGDEDEKMHWVIIAKPRYIEGNAFIVTVFMGRLTYFLDGLQMDFGSLMDFVCLFPR